MMSFVRVPLRSDSLSFDAEQMPYLERRFCSVDPTSMRNEDLLYLFWGRWVSTWAAHLHVETPTSLLYAYAASAVLLVVLSVVVVIIVVVVVVGAVGRWDDGGGGGNSGRSKF